MLQFEEKVNDIIVSIQNASWEMFQMEEAIVTALQAEQLAGNVDSCFGLNANKQL